MLSGPISLESSSLFFVLWMPDGSGPESVVFKDWLLQSPKEGQPSQARIRTEVEGGFDLSRRQIMSGLTQVKGRKKKREKNR